MEKQRVFIGAGFVILSFLVITHTTIPASFLAFLVLGIIPGTDVIVPAWAILLVYPALIGVALYWVYGEAFFIGAPTPSPKPIAATKAKAKKTKATRNSKKTTATKRRARAAA
jgi:hypothetical protein